MNINDTFLIHSQKAESRIYIICKKVLDCIGALAGLILLSPLLLLISLLIKLENPSSAILFKQIRVGKHGERFTMYKFRTMVSEADTLLEEIKVHNEIHGKMFKIKNDPRITKIGKCLRQTSLDELPQLWNVLTGSMSLVGPRPPLEREVAEYTLYEIKRLSVIPGCTGLWQISGRNELDFYDMLRLDFTYINEASLWLDLKIIVMTIPVMITRKGAF
ncbi:sugar transferase [Paenibacillus hexagrammi]|uniref:Sugar transferase n=1 Tax=Paenibacillus hexagrammi TaxID=2908839 RepID=A0ABY3SH20_9BACL|nr:sugar transferase [Paenibacillus sp. YPD9-1]UJF32780.1 sugar transferase [Paenibacillus sp. YPD9-1]